MKKLVCALLIILMFGSTAFASEDIPHIFYNECAEYAGQRVTLDCVFGANHGSSRDVWYKTENGYEYCCEIGWKDQVGLNRYLTGEEKQYLREPEQGKIHRLRVWLYGDGSTGGSSIAHCEVLPETVNLDDCVREYKNSCAEISVKSILRNPKSYEGRYTYVKFEGKILQVIEDKSWARDYLLAVNDYQDMIYLSHTVEDNDLPMLQGDTVAVYGYLPPKKVTESYNSLSGKQTVPYMWVEFWDLLDE